MKLKLFLLSFILVPNLVCAKGAGTSAGLILLHNSGARSSSLGDAFTTVSDDITALDFNPSSLATLELNQVSLHHEQGFFGDTFNKAMVGIRNPTNGVFGFSVGRYDSGKTDLYDGVSAPRSVTAEQDLLAVVGYGFRHNSVAWGSSLKYLKSQLAGANNASAVSADVGAQYQLTQRFRLGASGPLYQSKLRYADVGEKTPTVYRVGVGWIGQLPLATGKLPLHFLFDVPYDANDRLASLSFGAETQLGIMALRLGVNTRSDIQEFSLGTGFHFRQMSFDYSFGLVSNSTFESVHKLNLSFAFGESRDVLAASNQAVHYSRSNVEKQMENKRAKADGKSDAGNYRVHEVKSGETLESIAQTKLGSAARWADIFALNRAMYASPDQIKPGSRILIPSN